MAGYTDDLENEIARLNDTYQKLEEILIKHKDVIGDIGGGIGTVLGSVLDIFASKNGNNDTSLAEAFGTAGRWLGNFFGGLSEKKKKREKLDEIFDEIAAIEEQNRSVFEHAMNKFKKRVDTCLRFIEISNSRSIESFSTDSQSYIEMKANWYVTLKSKYYICRFENMLRLFDGLSALRSQYDRDAPDEASREMQKILRENYSINQYEILMESAEAIMKAATGNNSRSQELQRIDILYAEDSLLYLTAPYTNEYFLKKIESIFDGLVNKRKRTTNSPADTRTFLEAIEGSTLMERFHFLYMSLIRRLERYVFVVGGFLIPSVSLSILYIFWLSPRIFSVVIGTEIFLTAIVFLAGRLYARNSPTKFMERMGFRIGDEMDGQDFIQLFEEKLNTDELAMVLSETNQLLENNGELNATESRELPDDLY